MPGYRSLSTQLSGTAADHAREAEAHQRGGDAAMAAQLLEEALEASVRTRPEMPGWICGRLASIYRSLKRYDDEVMLLERYRESQTTEEARTRFDARLSKARAIADRKRRPVTGALETVRQVRRRSKERRRGATRQPASTATTSEITGLTPAEVELRAALLDLSPSGDVRLRSCLAQLCADGHERDLQMEDLVSTLKAVWEATPTPPDASPEAWRERRSNALVVLLALHFGEAA
ncbi:MAG: hypothetical protein JF589_03730 [Gemmatimonadetes bacterium]|jgi:hypothetical protein|nr:hypothetical protein [Gemmatimonadota bacterium]